MLESSKSYTRKIYVGKIGAYPRQTSIIVLQWVSSSNTLYKKHCIPTVLGILPYSYMHAHVQYADTVYIHSQLLYLIHDMAPTVSLQ
jgi:hypothetical protein